MRRAHEQRGADDVVVVAVARVDEEVHRLVGAIGDARQLRLVPELAVLGRAVAAVHLQAAAVDRRQQLVAEPRLALGRELHLLDARRAERDGEQPRHRLAEAGGVDGDAAHAPDVAQQVDEAGEQRLVRLAGPGVVLDDLEARLLDERRRASGWTTRAMVRTVESRRDDAGRRPLP